MWSQHEIVEHWRQGEQFKNEKRKKRELISQRKIKVKQMDRIVKWRVGSTKRTDRVHILELYVSFRCYRPLFVRDCRWHIGSHSLNCRHHESDDTETRQWKSNLLSWWHCIKHVKERRHYTYWRMGLAVGDGLLIPTFSSCFQNWSLVLACRRKHPKHPIEL